jgi:hypothetical protein
MRTPGTAPHSDDYTLAMAQVVGEVLQGESLLEYSFLPTTHFHRDQNQQNLCPKSVKGTQVDAGLRGALNLFHVYVNCLVDDRVPKGHLSHYQHPPRELSSLVLIGSSSSPSPASSFFYPLFSTHQDAYHIRPSPTTIDVVPTQ